MKALTNHWTCSHTFWLCMYFQKWKWTIKGHINILQLRPNKKISEFGAMGLKIIGRVDTHIFFFRKKYNFMHFERQNAFQNG